MDLSAVHVNKVEIQEDADVHRRRGAPDGAERTFVVDPLNLIQVMLAEG